MYNLTARGAINTERLDNRRSTGCLVGEVDSELELCVVARERAVVELNRDSAA